MLVHVSGGIWGCLWGGFEWVAALWWPTRVVFPRHTLFMHIQTGLTYNCNHRWWGGRRGGWWRGWWHGFIGNRISHSTSIGCSTGKFPGKRQWHFFVSSHAVPSNSNEKKEEIWGRLAQLGSHMEIASSRHRKKLIGCVDVVWLRLIGCVDGVMTYRSTIASGQLLHKETGQYLHTYLIVAEEENVTMRVSVRIWLWLEVRLWSKVML